MLIGHLKEVLTGLVLDERRRGHFRCSFSSEALSQ